MFDIVADWPDSTPAIFDLKKCFDLVPTNLKKEVAVSLKAAVAKRLLHPGNVIGVLFMLEESCVGEF